VREIKYKKIERLEVIANMPQEQQKQLFNVIDALIEIIKLKRRTTLKN
jgi:hypothetical protein